MATRQISSVRRLFHSITSRLFFLGVIASLLAVTATLHGQIPVPTPEVQPVPAPALQTVRKYSVGGPTAHLSVASAPAGAHLSYYGGPVISNVRIVVVYWGSGVSSVVTAGIPAYFQGITNSVWFDMLSEYSTNIKPSGSATTGTNQSIGRGSYVGAYTITPSVTSATITDAQIQTELLAQLNAGHLPLPQYDLQGNADTEYMIYFPPGKTISQGGINSCQAGGFCAYHGNVTYQAKYLPYTVMPDFSAGSGCDTGCGSSTQFGNVTSVTSHELAESVTDMAVGSATQANNPPLAWYDNVNGEIGDICNAQESTISTPTGVYTIQNQFSNAAGNCVSVSLHPNFKITSPATALPGAPFSFTLTALNPAGGLGTHISFAGTVHFSSTDGTAILPADYTFVPTDQGVHAFNATLNNFSSSITATDTVNGAITATGTVALGNDFSISPSPNALTVATGSSGPTTISTALVSGTAQTVALSLSGAPTGVTGAFVPTSVTSGNSSTLTLTVASNTVPGIYVLIVTGTATSGQHTANVTLTVTQAPAFTSAAATTFTVGSAGTFTVTATGSPAPTFSESGALPSGVTLSAAGSLTGTPAAGTGGTYPITITAGNGVSPNATQSFTLTVVQAPAITSASSTTFTVGIAGTFTVTATGSPASTFTASGTLPSGVTLTKAGLLSGTPAAGTGGTYPITITASNGVSPNATQSFTLTVTQAPAITSAAATTFSVGAVGTFTVTATGSPAPTFSETGALPSGVTLSAAGLLSGTPAVGSGGSYPITITASNGVSPNATQSFTLTVGQGPAITSANSTTFSVGAIGSFTVTATGSPAPTFSETGALPSGVTLTAAGLLSGTPAAGSGGSYPITITASNGVSPNATQNFTLTVGQGPVITSANSTTFAVGSAGTFTVTATGAPAPTFSEVGALPSGVTLSSAGVLSGTPATGSGGTYPITITASNGNLPNATQNFTLTVGQAPAFNSANSTNFSVGAVSSFTVSATGSPAPTFSETGALPSGITLSATGALSGTPVAGTGGSYPITITASNGVSPNATQAFMLTVGQAPVITSANNTTFVVGAVGSFNAIATGSPAPTFSETGALPNGVTFTSTGMLSGTPLAGTGGSYPITIIASNGVAPNATQSFTLTVGQGPVITSANATTFSIGSVGTFTVTALGTPSPTFSESGALPSGVTFSSFGVLTGTPAAGTGGSYPISIIASNGIAPNSIQSFTLTVVQGAAITSANHTTFAVGAAGTFTVTASGSPAPTFSETGALPTGVTLTPAGLLSGTPAAGTGGSYPITITASNGNLPNATQNFTLTVGQAPVNTSTNHATFTVGAAGTFSVTANGSPAPTFSETGALPSGVTLTSAGLLSGTPAAGTGGSYAITITAGNGSLPNATQSFTLTVNQPPAITSVATTTFNIGSAGSFQVVGTGYPAATFSYTGTLPNGVTLNTNGLLSGTPAAGTTGTYPLTITAANGVLPNATQSFTLTVGGGTSGSFSLTAYPDAETIYRGSPAYFFLVLQSQGGMRGTVALSCTGNPHGSTCSISPNNVSLTSNGFAVVTVNATNIRTPGTYVLTLKGQFGSISQSTQLTVTVR